MTAQTKMRSGVTGPSFAHRIRGAAEDCAKAPHSALPRAKLGELIRSGSEREFLRDCRHFGIGRTFWAAAHAMSVCHAADEAEQLSGLLKYLVGLRFLDSQKDPPRQNPRADLA